MAKSADEWGKQLTIEKGKTELYGLVAVNIDRSFGTYSYEISISVLL